MRAKRIKICLIGIVAVGIWVATIGVRSQPAISFVVLNCTTNRLSDQTTTVFSGGQYVVAVVAVTNHSNRSVTYSETVSDEPGVEIVGVTGIRGVNIRNAHTHERVLSPGMGVTFKAIPNLYDRGLVFHYRDVQLIHRIWDRLPEFVTEWLPSLSPDRAIQAEF